MFDLSLFGETETREKATTKREENFNQDFGSARNKRHSTCEDNIHLDIHGTPLLSNGTVIMFSSPRRARARASLAGDKVQLHDKKPHLVIFYRPICEGTFPTRIMSILERSRRKFQDVLRQATEADAQAELNLSQTYDTESGHVAATFDPVSSLSTADQVGIFEQVSLDNLDRDTSTSMIFDHQQPKASMTMMTLEDVKTANDEAKSASAKFHEEDRHSDHQADKILSYDDKTSLATTYPLMFEEGRVQILKTDEQYFRPDLKKPMPSIEHCPNCGYSLTTSTKNGSNDFIPAPSKNAKHHYIFAPSGNAENHYVTASSENAVTPRTQRKRKILSPASAQRKKECNRLRSKAYRERKKEELERLKLKVIQAQQEASEAWKVVMKPTKENRPLRY